MSKASIAVVAFLIVAALGGAAAYFGPGIPGLRKAAPNMIVCQGETRAGCGGAAEHFLGCDTDLAAWIKSIRRDACVNVAVKKLSQVSSGGACGYATYELVCSR